MVLIVPLVYIEGRPDIRSRYHTGVNNSVGMLFTLETFCVVLRV